MKIPTWREFEDAFERKHGHVERIGSLLFFLLDNLPWVEPRLTLDRVYKIKSVDTWHNHARIEITESMPTIDALGKLEYEVVAIIHLSEETLGLNPWVTEDMSLRGDLFHVKRVGGFSREVGEHNLLVGKFSIHVGRHCMQFEKTKVG